MNNKGDQLWKCLFLLTISTGVVGFAYIFALIYIHFGIWTLLATALPTAAGMVALNYLYNAILHWLDKKYRN